jgi:hypothetical protein
MIVSFHRLTSSSFMIIVTCHPTEPNTACILGTVAFDPCFSVLLEKLIVTLLVKKLSSFYGTQRFITVFTRARQHGKVRPWVADGGEVRIY